MSKKALDISEILQEEVDKIAEERWAKDDCKPEFIVSLFETGEKDKMEHQILLTVRHCGFSLSRTIFPRIECKYGYEPLEKEMEWLYNATM